MIGKQFVNMLHRYYRAILLTPQEIRQLGPRQRFDHGLQEEVSDRLRVYFGERFVKCEFEGLAMDDLIYALSRICFPQLKLAAMGPRPQLHQH